MSARTANAAPGHVGVDPAPFGELAPSRALLAALEARRPITCGGLWGSSQAALLALAARSRAGSWLCVLSTEAEAQAFASDLATFGLSCEQLPAREDASDLDAVRGRLRVAEALSGPRAGRPRVLLASLPALLQPLPEPEQLRRGFARLAQNETLDAESLLERLAAAGFARVPLVERAGEMSLRGDIFDVYPFDAEWPLRIELYGRQIESLRSFDPADQRSRESFAQISLCLASDAGSVESGAGPLVLALLDADAVVAEIEPLRIEDQAQGLRVRSSAHAHALLEHARLAQTHPRCALQSLPSGAHDFELRSVQSLSADPRAVHAALVQACAGGARASILCQTEAERERFLESIAEQGAIEGLEARVGSLSRGFRVPQLRWSVASHRELIGAHVARRSAPARPAHRVRALESFFELRTGDLVVHSVHGLAHYRGLVRMERNGGEEDHLHLSFADEVSLYVPAGRIDLVQRYVGSGGQGAGAPALDRIGSQSFRKRKERVERALVDLAAELLEVQARRALNRREPWPADDELVRNMVAAFPHVDTVDQERADREISADLHGERPLDRLLCGDVGFGKTEIALRAAFRVANAGAQVAVLVPTTVLARQHYETFRERLADFPIEVAGLSRTTSARDARQIAQRLAAGEIDVLVGTHRILSKDIEFKRLGLLVIDEEQRFGVTHKEHFKRLRANVDVLTLTATPIPRTLHMSLAGVRDISSLAVPPPGRQDVETKIAYRDDDELVRSILLKEKERGAQAFFLHNRVRSIDLVARKLQGLVPECSFAVGHGQMSGRELEAVMRRFTEQEVDVLVSTAIVENGIDIPSAGAILIDEADLFGLAELHQLRGRVGRGAHKSSCWLLVERSKPLPEIARTRLKALEELSQLGAGFGISMKDLEIRGAGNILGPEQSGHIAAIGYDMYCRLLKRTVEDLAHRGPGASGAAAAPASASPAHVAELESAQVELELGLAAYLPEDYVPTAEARLAALRELGAAQTPDDVERALGALRDRFGRPPAAVLELARQARLRTRLARIGVTRLSWRGEFFLIEYRDRVELERAFGGARARIDLRQLRSGVAHLHPARGAQHAAAAALEWFERALKDDAGETTMRAAR